MLGRALAARLTGSLFSISIGSTCSLEEEDTNGLLMVGRLDDRLSEQRHRTPPANDRVGLERWTRSAFRLRGGLLGARGVQASGRVITEKHHMRATSAEQGKRGLETGGVHAHRICVLLKRSLFDALAHSDAWHLRKIICHWVLSLIASGSRAAGAGRT